MIGIQLVAILFALWMIYFTYLHYRRNDFTLNELVLWLVIWCAFLVIIFFPSSVKWVLATFKINRTFDFIVISGFIVLTAISFRNFVSIKRFEKKLEHWVREESLRDLHSK